jgi:hypothetical protein
MTSPTSTTPPKAPVRPPIWKELIEQERRYREKLIKVRAKRRRMPTHAECLEALVELGAEERMKNFTVFDTGHIDGGAYRIVELADGSARVEEWRGDKWVPGGASFGEIADAPPVGAKFAAELGIPISDIRVTPPVRTEAECDDRESKVMLETLDRLIEKHRRRRSSKLSAKDLREAIQIGVQLAEEEALFKLTMKAKQVAELDRRRGIRLVVDNIKPRQV